MVNERVAKARNIVICGWSTPEPSCVFDQEYLSWKRLIISENKPAKQENWVVRFINPEII